MDTTRGGSLIPRQTLVDDRGVDGDDNPRWYDDDEVLLSVVAAATHDGVRPLRLAWHQAIAQAAVGTVELDEELLALSQNVAVEPEVRACER